MKYSFSLPELEEKFSRGELSQEVIEERRESSKGEIFLEVDGGRYAAAIAQNLLNFLAVEGRAAGEEFVDEIKVNISGNDLGSLIGSQGKTLQAFEQVLSAMVNKRAVVHKRVLVDAEGYWARREEYLISLAKKVAQKALKDRREISLGPYRARERRIIHLALKDFPGVYTESIGEEPQRFVVVKIEAAKK